MPNENAKKGDALEQAVRLIQETILKSDPGLKGTEFSIEIKKTVITDAGVRHEIDVFVKTLPGTPFESICIFECKNWSDPVGKNEVIVLAEKVNALGATRGWLVARELTNYAEAQFKTHSRLKFIRCTDDFLSPLDSMRLLHVVREIFPISVAIKEYGVPTKERPDRLEWKNVPCAFDGKAINFVEFMKRHVDECIATDEKEQAAEYRNEGVHWSERAELVQFENGEFLIGNCEVEHMKIVVRSIVTVCRRKIISKFELSEQGRVFLFEPVAGMMPGRSVEISVVQRL